ncbi:hypothetical protein INT46_010750 [Mucor plumbeus]|uniref:Major facilitator superfamily (MFS) profile domain-containing protein n=1 Tax=Mucor plumbeus TaxID=97098 RepID=A0A8H7VB78_9FUNG|nr:hypothetical protein INT46_010750 [Mucor plumbeus]
MDPQETLSKSYTDSISSYLYEQDEDIHSLNNNNLNTNIINQSINSNLSNFNSVGYTTPIIAIPKIIDSRRGSHHTNVSSLKQPDIEDYSFSDNESFDQNSSDYYHDEQTTPLPKIQMLVISILLFSEPLTSTILFPFIYFMIKDFHLSNDEKEIGSYAGWITSVFFIAQFCTAIMWGRVSDRYGRRPVLLTGLIGNSVSSCLFGLSKNLWWAIGSRALCGIMNGNSGVARSMVSEITDNTNKAKAFSIFGFCWGAGMIAGPALGGYLAKPVEQFPDIFGNSDFFKNYPYFLPCFVSSCGSLIGFIVGYFYLEESNPSVLANKKWETENQVNERTALLTNNTMEESITKRILPKSGSMRLITQTSIIVIISYSVFGFHAMVFEEVLPLYFTAPVPAGGLGITRTDFAKALSFFGVIQLVFQFGIYPRLTKQYSTLVLCRVAFLIFIPVYFLFPELNTLREWIASNGQLSSGNASETWTFRFAYLALMLIRYTGCSLAFTGLGIMVSTSAAPEILGTVNGICQSCLSLVRALGPTFGGTLWSMSIKDGNKFPFDRHLVYYIIGFLTIFSFFQSLYISKSVALGGNKKR